MLEYVLAREGMLRGVDVDHPSAAVRACLHLGGTTSGLSAILGLPTRPAVSGGRVGQKAIRDDADEADEDDTLNDWA